MTMTITTVLVRSRMPVPTDASPVVVGPARIVTVTGPGVSRPLVVSRYCAGRQRARVELTDPGTVTGTVGAALSTGADGIWIQDRQELLGVASRLEWQLVTLGRFADVPVTAWDHTAPPTARIVPPYDGVTSGPLPRHRVDRSRE